MTMSQYDGHTLHCALGSTSSSSHSSVFPAALITSLDSLLKRLNARCCWRSLRSACRWGWFSIFWIKFWTLTSCDRFTAECGNPGMLKSMFSLLITRLNSLSALTDVMSRFSSGANCSFTMCVLALDFTSSPVPSWTCMTRMFSDSFTCFSVLSEEPCSLWKSLSSISCERDVFRLSTKTRYVSSGFSDRSQIGLDFDWDCLECDTWCFSKRLLNEFSNCLLFNWRAQLIIPFDLIVIVSRIRRTNHVRLSFQIDGFLTDPAQLWCDTSSMIQME